MTIKNSHAIAAVETSAAIAGVSFRASSEFLRAAPAASQILEPEDLRLWGELGRRIAMGDVDTAVAFFAAGAENLKDIPSEARHLVFQLCSRQISMSSSVAIQSFGLIPQLAVVAKTPQVLRSLLQIAAEISKRSAKHSSDFLNETPGIITDLRTSCDPEIIEDALRLVTTFAVRAGGLAADVWRTMPAALSNLQPASARRLLDETFVFIERSGGAALQVLISGGEILRILPDIFKDWLELLQIVAEHGSASLVAFVRESPRFVRGLASQVVSHRATELAHRVLQLTSEIAKQDGEAALACFRSSTLALHKVSVEQFEQWARYGLTDRGVDSRARRSYFALETRGSHSILHSGNTGLALESVQHLLRFYVEALTGREVEVVPLAAVPVETRIGDGRTIHLPSVVTEFGDAELDFRLYKVLAAHAAGQIEFGTQERGSPALLAAYTAIAETYDPQNLDARDAFALGGYINDLSQSSAAVPDARSTIRKAQSPEDTNYRTILELFPYPQLARRIFGTLENGRIDRQLRYRYRGLVRDLNLIREHLRRGRNPIATIPAALAPFELLFQIALLGGALDDSRQYYRQIVSELETIVDQYLSRPTARVADTLMATSRVYSLFQSVAQAEDSTLEEMQQTEESEAGDDTAATSDSFNALPKQQEPQRRDARELFNAWNDPDAEGEFDELEGGELWREAENPEHQLEEGDVAYSYDEWDRELADHRVGWCRVIEKRVKVGDLKFVEQTRERYKGIIASIRHQFQLMKPEELTRVANELDGEEYDLNAVVDYIIDRRADGQQSERLYTKRLRRRRDVTVSFLLDQSSSTARTIGRHPLQPYTRPGRRIIEIEKEGLVLMSEALEAVGDVYSICGFTSEGRRNVKFYVVKSFNERYSDQVKRRIGGINYQNNTRLGAAVRHATAKLVQQEARTKLLIVLSDGRPYDHDYGDARYAREDTREALRQAKVQGITPFCITIDRESEAELRDLYGEVGYIIIDDVLSLPERLPAIYRRLTS